MTGKQLATAVLTVLIAAMLGAVIAFQRGNPRRWSYSILWACALVSMAAWTNFGSFQRLAIDADRAQSGPGRKKVALHRPFHFHDFVHYYLGPKYFQELGYLRLYDCLAVADREIAEEDRAPPKIGGYIRDLGNVLKDKPYERALSECRTDALPRFTAERWRSFKGDVRELARLVDDGAWGGVVFDAGFNPPPSLVLVSGPITNLIPIHAGGWGTYLFATAIDLALLVLGWRAIRSAFGRTTAIVAALYFGATFVSHYSWNGGSVLRFSWLVTVVFALSALKRERWTLAAVLLGAATCDRIFPAAFAIGALVPIAVRAVESPQHRVVLRRFVLAYAATVAALVIVSAAVFGTGAWSSFFARILHHGDVYFVQHLGLKKVLTYREWVHSQSFHGHDGLARFESWNVQLRASWRDLRPVALPIQAAIVAGTAWASIRRRPYESALLAGIVFMFTFNLPANYYYAVLTLIPPLLLRAAATAPSPAARYRHFLAFAAFNVFWMFTFVAPHVSGDDIVFTFLISTGCLAFLVAWIVAWAERDAWTTDLAPLRERWRRRRQSAV